MCLGELLNSLVLVASCGCEDFTVYDDHGMKMTKCKRLFLF